MASAGHHAPPATPTPARFPANAHTSQSESVQSKRDLTSWWRGFKKRDNKIEEQRAPPGIFGIPLHESITYANVAISLFDDDGKSYIYGYVPIVVAKCGVFLKEKATETEGIFRLAGSEKRIKELKTAFDSPEKYGKGLDWTGYTVHDAANVLRRYFNQLPEPIIPLTFYERFRDPLRKYSGSSDMTEFNPDTAISAYQGLITEVPPLNRQLLLYILDLLAVFASKSETNKMTTPNLAAIFQPGILSHPQHDMAPQEYRLSQDVLIFLIENQDSFLIGMHGTAADEKTVKQVQSGYKSNDSPSIPSRTMTALRRSSSNASGASQGARKFSGIRRNVSTSSRNSSIPSSPQIGSPPLGSGVHRSNTVPSQRTNSSPRFTPREKTPEPPTSVAEVPGAEPDTVPEVPEPEVEQQTPKIAEGQIETPATVNIMSASSSEATTPIAAPGSDTSSAILIPKERPESETKPALLTPEAALRETSQSHERSGSRNFLDIFRPSPGAEQEPRTPRKLQKKRAPGGSVSSAHSSVNDLGQEQGDVMDPIGSPQTSPRTNFETKDTSSQRAVSESLQAGSPYMSEQSRASVTDVSDAEALDESVTSEKQERKKRWRFSHSARSRQSSDAGSETNKPSGLRPAMVASSSEASRTESGSSTSHGHAGTSSQTPTTESTTITEPNSTPSEAEDKKKGPISWIRGKIVDRKDKDRDAEKRAKSPAAVSQRSDHVSRDSIVADQTMPTTSVSSESQGMESTSSTEKVSTSPGTPTPTPSTTKMETVVEAPAAEEEQPAVVIAGSEEDAAKKERLLIA